MPCLCPLTWEIYSIGARVLALQRAVRARYLEPERFTQTWRVGACFVGDHSGDTLPRPSFSDIGFEQSIAWFCCYCCFGVSIKSRKPIATGTIAQLTSMNAQKMIVSMRRLPIRKSSATRSTQHCEVKQKVCQIKQRWKLSGVCLADSQPLYATCLYDEPNEATYLLIVCWYSPDISMMRWMVKRSMRTRSCGCAPARRRAKSSCCSTSSMPAILGNTTPWRRSW